MVIYFRDLKPENILLVHSNNDVEVISWQCFYQYIFHASSYVAHFNSLDLILFVRVQIKLTDFGLAKRANQEGLKTFCGTPQV
jgi:serine/threonine protein kinase